MKKRNLYKKNSNTMNMSGSPILWTALTSFRHGIGLRPSLIFNHYNCDMFLDKFELAIIEINKHLLVYE